jgi:hypothetical protein
MIPEGLTPHQAQQIRNYLEADCIKNLVEWWSSERYALHYLIGFISGDNPDQFEWIYEVAQANAKEARERRVADLPKGKGKK